MSLQFIIDGYNIINHPLYQPSRKNNSNPQSSLLAFIKTRRLTGSPKNKVLIVFDGYPPAASTIEEPYLNAGIIFSRKISADEKIKKLVEEAGNRKTIMVVTNDREIQFMVKSLGARVITVEDFIPEKKSAKNKSEDSSEGQLNYSQIEEINKELGKLWLKK